MIAPREPNSEELELLTLSILDKRPESGAFFDKEAYDDTVCSMVAGASIAVFDSTSFEHSANEIELDNIHKLLVVLWPQSPNCYEVFAITNKHTLVALHQSEDVREPVHVSTP